MQCLQGLHAEIEQLHVESNSDGSTSLHSRQQKAGRGLETKLSKTPGMVRASRLYSVDWTRDWTVGLGLGTGLTQSCTHPTLMQHTLQMFADHLSHARTKGFGIVQRNYCCTHDPHLHVHVAG